MGIKMNNNSIVDDLFPEVWLVTTKNRAPFGNAWIGPNKFVYGEKILVARFSKRIGGDGQSVEVYESRLPARFWHIRVAAGYNSAGETQEAWGLATGSGDDKDAELVVQIAKRIAQGMLGFRE